MRVPVAAGCHPQAGADGDRAIPRPPIDELRRGRPRALVQIDPRSEFVKAAIPLLIETLTRPNPAARREAARTLGRIGKDSPAALKALKGAANDPDPEVRRAVAEAVKALQR